MRTVGLKVLKNKLDEYVRLAAGGETVLVTDSNRVVAELVPPEAGRNAGSADESWAELIHQGVVTPATIVGKGPPPRMPIKGVTIDQLMKELDEDRADRDLP
jgi:antitoxin (DNA-binding transcriptional repressor) of toxin-antitoxin stability system